MKSKYWIGVMAALFSITLMGCSKQTTEQTMESEMEQNVENVVLVEEEVQEGEQNDSNLEFLLRESNFSNYLTGLCGEMKLEFAEFHPKAGEMFPTLVGFCHHGGNTDLEWEVPIVAVAQYKDASDRWTFEVIDWMPQTHPSHVVGIIELQNGDEGLVIERSESNALFGGTVVDVILIKGGHFVFETLGSQYTQYAEVSIRNNTAILIEDSQVEETFTFEDGEFIKNSRLKKTSIKADYVITIDIDENGQLKGSLPSGSYLHVSPGDTVYIRRARPIELLNFQVRGDLDWINDELFMVREGTMGQKFTMGNYPFDELIEYTIGTTIRSEFGQQVMTKDFLTSLQKGKMPGAEANFSMNRDELYRKLGTPFEEIGWGGANYLGYGNYYYSVAFPHDDFKGIYSIIRHVPPSDGIMGSEIIEVWGEPDHLITEGDEDSGIAQLYYKQANTYVHVAGPDANTLVTAIELMNEDRNN